ncbi:MAG: hypothetical protein L7U87_03765, partial [Chlamydiales bacterium]|nr:hypothetical protein [Chlamydiales bacterium]
APSEDPTKFSSREIGAFAASIDPTKAAKKLTQLGVKLERERFGSDKAGDNISVLVVRVPANVKAAEEKHDEGDEEASVDINALLGQLGEFIPMITKSQLDFSEILFGDVARVLVDDSISTEDKRNLLEPLASVIPELSREAYIALVEKIEELSDNKGDLFEALAEKVHEQQEVDSLALERAVGLFQRSVDAGVDLHPENKGRFLMSIESLPKGVLDKDPSKKERIKAFVTELAKEGDDFAIEVYSSIKLSEIEDVSAITYDTLELWEGISDSMKARVYCSLALKILTPSTNKEIGYDYFPKTTDLADKQSSFNKLVSTLEELNEKQLLSYTHPIILVRLKSNFTKLGSHLKLTSQELPDKTEALDPLFFASLKRCLTFFKNGSYELAPYFLEAKNLKSIEAEVMQGFYQELFQAIGELDQADVSLPKEIVGESWIDFSYNIAGSHTEPALEALRSMLDEGNIFAADILAEYLYYEPTKPDAVLQEIAKIIVNSKVKEETKETLLEETRKTFFSTDPEGFEEAFAKLDSLTENKGDLAKALVTGGIEGDRLSIARVFQVAIKQKLELTPEEKGFYSEVCGTALDTVLESESKHYIDLGIHIEEGKFDRLGIAILDSIDRNRHAKNQKQIRHLLSLLNLHKLEGDSTFNVLEGIYALEDGALKENKEKELFKTLAQFFANFGMVEEQSSQQLMWSLSFCSKAAVYDKKICRAALVEILSKDGYEFTDRDKEVIVKLYGILSGLGFDEGFDAFGDKVEGFIEELALAHDSFDLDGFLKKENHFLEQKSLADEEGVIYEEYLPAAAAILSPQAGSLLKEIGEALTLCETPDAIFEHFLGGVPLDGGSEIHDALRDAISNLEGVDKDFKDQLSIKLYDFFDRKYTSEIKADESNSKRTKWTLLELKYLMGVDAKNLGESDAEIYHHKLIFCLSAFVGKESFTLSHQEIFDCLLKLHQPISG